MYLVAPTLNASFGAADAASEALVCKNYANVEEVSSTLGGGRGWPWVETRAEAKQRLAIEKEI